MKIAFVTVLLAACFELSAAQTFHLTDLGVLNGTASRAKGINNAGQVVGYITTTGGAHHAFLYSNGVMTDLGTLGGTKSEANAINDSGVVVGMSTLAGDAVQHAFWYDGTFHDLKTLAGNWSYAYGINSKNKIVGISSTSTSNVFHAFYYDGTTMNDLGTLGGDFSYATAINSSGLIVGDSNTSSQAEHAFKYSNDLMSDLGTLPGGFGSTAYAVNAAGQIAGYSYQTSSVAQGFVVTNGTMSPIPLYQSLGSLAFGINSTGVIVGSTEFDLASGALGLYYANGTLKNLNTMMDASGSGWTIEEAIGINDNGQIAASAANSAGAIHAVILSSAPAVVNQSYTMAEHQTLTKNGANGVLKGSNVASGASVVATTTHGTLTLASDGSFTYTPTAGFLGPDYFTYKAVIGGTASNLGSARIFVGRIYK